MSELSSIMHVFHEDARRTEAERKATMKKVKYTISFTLDEDQYDKDNYSLDAKGLALSDEALEALTLEDMVALDVAYLKDSELSLSELTMEAELILDDIKTEIEEVDA